VSRSTLSLKHRDTLFGPDAALAALVVVVVGLMIVPLPTWALDLLISANLSAAIAILLVVLYVPDAIGIATFPTLLLLTTLFRLALNVASTRLILLQANAGEVIRPSARSWCGATTSSARSSFSC
jgi:type III secretion protein V